MTVFGAWKPTMVFYWRAGGDLGPFPEYGMVFSFAQISRVKLFGIEIMAAAMPKNIFSMRQQLMTVVLSLMAAPKATYG